MSLAVALLLASQAVLTQSLVTESVHTTPGITEKAMTDALTKALPALEKCVPEFFPTEAADIDDRLWISFPVGVRSKPAATQLIERLDVNGPVSNDCVKKVLTKTAVPTTRANREVTVEWRLRVKIDPANARELRAKARAEIREFCDVFRERLQLAAKTKGKSSDDAAGWLVGPAVTDFLRKRGVKMGSTDLPAFLKADLGPAKLTRHGEEWVTTLMHANPADMQAVALANAEELGETQSCAELSKWRPTYP